LRILVTGATGFIGARLVDVLLARGGSEVIFSGRREPADKTFQRRGAQFVSGELADATFAERLTKGVDSIVHCAGLAGTWGPYADYYRANVLTTENLLRAAQTNGATRFVNLSSPSIYFDFKDQLDLREDFLPAHFSNAYARSKYEAELLVRRFHDRNGLQTVSLRPRSVIGAGDNNILPRLIRLQRDGLLKRIGRGKNVVDITTIGNLLDALVLCLDAPAAALGETYNISNGAPVPFWDFVAQVLQKFDLPMPRSQVPYALAMTLARLNEWRCRLLGARDEPSLLPVPIGILGLSMTMNIDKARQRLGYAPRFSTQDGIDEFCENFRAARTRAASTV
jgi:2-alkyl-3-oxoalkanoate reductase